MISRLTARPILVLLIAFVVSVVIRWPNLNRPLSKHHEFCTAVALRTMDIWYTNGIVPFKGNPVTNFPGQANKHINNYASVTGAMLDDGSNYYYTSHPPLAYYLPYITFVLLGKAPSVLGIQIFHLFINLICVWLVYLIGRQLWPKHTGPPLVAALLYLFTPAVLWFQSNTYMSDMLVQLPFIMVIWLCLKLIKNDAAWLMALTALVCGLAVYTSWLGIFLAVTLLMHALLIIREDKKYLALAGFTLLFSGLFIALFVWQYSLINGFAAFKIEASNRFQQRGGVDWLFRDYWTIFFNYLTGYGLLMLAVPVGIYAVVKAKYAQLRTLAVVSVLPVVMLHTVLTNYSGHDFTVLHGAVFLSLFGAWGYAQLARRRLTHARLAFVLITLLGIGQYYYINRPGDYSWKGDRYNVYQTIGEQIQVQAGTNEVIFLTGTLPTPEMIWYARRNIKHVAGYGEAYDFLVTTGQKQGVLFTGNTSQITATKHFEVTER